jgi:hypothetical protein
MMRSTHAFHPTSFDYLETREVLSHLGLFMALPVHPIHNAAAIVPTVHVRAPAAVSVTRADTTTTVTAMQSIGEPLTDIYLASQNGASADGLAASFPTVSFQGNLVGVSLRARTDANALATELKTLGASIVTTSTANLAVEAFVPVGKLLAVAQLDQTLYGSPMYKPVFHGPVRHGGLLR